MIVPIVSIPSSIANGLADYKDQFPRSETFQHIQEYCTGMTVLDRPRALTTLFSIVSFVAEETDIS